MNTIFLYSNTVFIYDRLTVSSSCNCEITLNKTSGDKLNINKIKLCASINSFIFSLT